MTMKTLLLALPLLALAACGDKGEEVVETDDAPEATQIETPTPRDITAIDAATDYDGGLADDDVPGRDAPATDDAEEE